ncbi:MAG TPA: hypothetical protein VGV87_25690 [Blastocatellia bacterium]|jgi:hypothetical protein|nr:hypothetical protein [Blastocatellia bacterium]
MTADELTVEPDGSSDIDSCDCCGNASKSVWGFIRKRQEPVAAYFVGWAVGHPEHGANFDLILGEWGDGTSAQDRVAVSLSYRRTADGDGFMIVDAASSTTGKSDLVGCALTRDQVVGTPLAQLSFDIVDAIWLQDLRIDEVRRIK